MQCSTNCIAWSLSRVDTGHSLIAMYGIIQVYYTLEMVLLPGQWVHGEASGVCVSYATGSAIDNGRFG